eukprot:365916-Chlamydomonas_euryale.AAC.5
MACPLEHTSITTYAALPRPMADPTSSFPHACLPPAPHLHSPPPCPRPACTPSCTTPACTPSCTTPACTPLPA